MDEAGFATPPEPGNKRFSRVEVDGINTMVGQANKVVKSASLPRSRASRLRGVREGSPMEE